MNGVGLVARRELVTRIRERGFLVSFGIMLIILVSIIVLPKVLGGDDNHFSVGLVGNARQIEEPLRQSARAAGVTLDLSTVDSEDAARRMVNDDEIDAVVIDDRTILVKDNLNSRLELLLQGAHQQVVSTARLAAAGLDAERVRQALGVPALTVDRLQGSDTESGRKQAVAFIAVVFLYGQLFGFAMWVALGVVEEKASRVVELILATLRPWQLLAGKVLGIGALGLAQFLALGAAGLVAASAVDVITVPTEAIGTLAHVLLWFVLGYGFYSCMAAAIAARVSRQEDLQNALGPLQVLLMGSFFLGIFAGQDPTSRMAEVASYVPPFSAIMMPLRYAAGQATVWQVVLAFALMALATVVLVRIAGWVYAGAVLRTGGKVRLGDALRAGREHVPAG